MAIADLYEETITLPRALRFPVELRAPEGFDTEKLETWPRLVGRLEHVEGRLLYLHAAAWGRAAMVAPTRVAITAAALQPFW